MADNPEHVHMTNLSTPVSQEEKDRATRAVEQLRIACKEIGSRHGAIALIDALISVWIDLNLTLFGVSLTDKALRHLRRDLARIAAVHRGMQAKSEGRADG